MGSLFEKWKKGLKKKVHPFCTAIVPAAGKSSRMGGEDKMFAPLCGVPVLARTLTVLDQAVLVDEIVVAAQPEKLEEVEYLAVHDGARPLVLPEQVDDLIRLGQRTYAVAPAVPVTDTVKVADLSGLVLSTPDRSTLYAVQTPQVFDRDLLAAALQNAKTQGLAVTDDCSAVEALGMPVQLTDGDEENLKITTPLDLELAALILRRRAEA